MTETERVGYGKEKTKLYRVNLVTSCLKEQLFLREDQKFNFNNIPNKRYERLGWQVVEVKNTDRVEDVYCAQVPKYAAFTLESGVVTGNCFTCHQTGNIPKLISKLSGLRGEDYTSLTIRALVEETPDSFNEWDDYKAELSEPLSPLDKSVYFRMYPSVLKFKSARRYLAKRKISEETAKLLQLRFDPDDARILFPVFSGEEGQLYGFTGRSIGDSKIKVKDYSGLRKERLVLGEQLIKKDVPILVVEGLFAFATMYELCVDEFCSPVATMGSRLSESQRDLLVEFDLPIVLLYDNDEAGRQGLYGPKQSNGKFQGGGAVDALKSHVPTLIAEYPEGVADPDELTHEEVKDMVLGTGHIIA